MKQILKLVFLLVIGQTAFAQAPSNYTNINGRYRWIAGMFDSTFHIPKGSTPSLRTGGSTNAGALFYRTSDSTVRYWTGSQWLTLSDTTRFVPYVGATKDVDLNSWSLNAKSLHIKGTAGQGHLGLKFQSATPNMSANESGVYADASGNFGIKIDNAYTSIFKTSLNSADRTYTFQNKSYTVADSADVAAKIEGTLISGYLTKATGTKTIDTSQIYQTNGKIGIGKTNPTAKVDVYDSLGTSIKSTMRAQINTDVALDVKTVGNRGFALIVDQADSVASGTQYQTLFRKSMMPGTGNPANGGGVSWYTQIGNDNNVYRALSVYRARVIDSTGFANSNIQQTSTEFWTRKAGVWDTTLVLNGGNVGINTGQNGIDSALTVANGTWLKRGVRMSALPTGVGTKAVRIDANGTLSVADTLANGVSGSGTTNYVSKFTGSGTIGNSQIFDNASAVGINTITPTSGIRLDVNGNIQAKNEITVQGRDSDGLGTIWLNDVSSSFSYLQGTPSSNEFRFWVRSNGKYKFSIDNTEMIRVNTTGVGIGTITPDSLLTVNLGTHLKRGVRMSGLPTGTGTKSLRVDANGTVSLADTLANGISGTGTTNYIPKFTSSSAIGNSNFITDASGNLGIGAVSLGSGLRLYVVQASGEGNPTLDGSEVALFQRNFVSAQSSSIAITSGSASTSSLYFGDKDNVSIGKLTYDNSSNAMIFNTNGSERMRLDASGNLLVGTTTASGFANRYIELNDATDNTGINFKVADVGQGYVYVDDSNNEFRLSATGASNVNSMTFFTGGTERARLDASGNLGLGVTPSAWGSAGGSAKGFQLGNGGGLYSSGAGNTLSTLVHAGYYNGTSWIYNYTNVSVGRYEITGANAGSTHAWYNSVGGTAGNPISFTQAMTLDASGRLGIGITNPSTKLYVQSSDADYVGVFKNTNASGYGLQVYTQGSSTNLAFQVRTNNGSTNAFQVLDNGNVGISTTSPSGNFDIFSSSNVYQNISTNGTNQSAVLSLYNSTATGDGAALGYNVAMRFGTITGLNAAGFTERMRITSGGNVLVGTTTDIGQKLYVNGDARIGSLLYLASEGAGTVLGDISTGSYLRFLVSNSERMRITSGGELLIGTTSDAGDYKLQVNGNVYAGGRMDIYENTNAGTLRLSRDAGSARGYLHFGRLNSGSFQNVGTISVDSDASSPNNGIMTFFTSNSSGVATQALKLTSTQNAEFAGSIKTAAPSGGTAAAWKLGERVASSGVTFNDQQYIQLDIGGTLYYLATVDLPMPEAYPQATSGPSNNYKITPVQVKTTRDAEIEKLRKEIEELKQLIKNK